MQEQWMNTQNKHDVASSVTSYTDGIGHFKHEYLPYKGNLNGINMDMESFRIATIVWRFSHCMLC
jgi:hypothetical protein